MSRMRKTGNGLLILSIIFAIIGDVPKVTHGTVLVLGIGLLIIDNRRQKFPWWY